MRRIPELIVTLLLRGVLSMIAIYFINEALAMKGIDICVGINLFTFIISVFLGFPGVLLFYAIGVIELL